MSTWPKNADPESGCPAHSDAKPPRLGRMALFESVAAGDVTPEDAATRMMAEDTCYHSENVLIATGRYITAEDVDALREAVLRHDYVGDELSREALPSLSPGWFGAVVALSFLVALGVVIGGAL